VSIITISPPTAASINNTIRTNSIHRCMLLLIRKRRVDLRPLMTLKASLINATGNIAS
jgi:hypothetical protein